MVKGACAINIVEAKANGMNNNHSSNSIRPNFVV